MPSTTPAYDFLDDVPARPLGSLTDWTEAVFLRAGLDPAHAGPAAARLLLADAMGVGTHGLARLPSYWKQLRSGGLNPRPRMSTEWRGSALIVEADLALGQICGPFTLASAAAAIGPERPVVTFLIRDAGHLGALGTYLLDVAEAGLVAFLCQVTQPVMSPEGSTKPGIGNNPLAFAAPRPDGPPLVFDFAASRVARGKVHLALRDGKPLEPGWAIGPDGAPTLDPETALAGSILPAADHKGLALAMMVEVLAGALTGARPALSSGGAPGGVGAFGFVLDPALLAGADGYASVMTAWVTHYLDAVGPHGRIPGQRAASLRARAEREGIRLAPALVGLLRTLGDEAGAPFP